MPKSDVLDGPWRQFSRLPGLRQVWPDYLLRRNLRQRRAACDARVVPEPCRNDFNALRGAGQGALLGDFFDDRDHLVFELLDDAATKDDKFRVEEIQKIAHGNACK